MTITIRLARSEDAPGIAKVHVDSWRTTYKGLIADEFLAALSHEQRTLYWTQNLADPPSASFVYIAETRPGEIVGFVSAGPEGQGDPNYRGEIYAIYLLNQVQRQGVGRELIHIAMQELCERSFSSMLLWVLKDNLPAREFYQAVGGELLREKPIEIGGQTLIEVAYGWKNLLTYISSNKEVPCPPNSVI
ncbi:MAG: GNAT family N-acetyltransferase [Anaerolineales bacterium]